MNIGPVREGASQNTGNPVLAQTVTITFANAAVAVEAFIIPANSRILEFTVDVTIAFDSSGTDLLQIGISGDADHYANALDLSSIARVLGSSDASQIPAYPTVGTAAETIELLYSQSVADAAAGTATVTVTYVQI